MRTSEPLSGQAITVGLEPVLLSSLLAGAAFSADANAVTLFNGNGVLYVAFADEAPASTADMARLATSQAPQFCWKGAALAKLYVAAAVEMAVYVLEEYLAPEL